MAASYHHNYDSRFYPNSGPNKLSTDLLAPFCQQKPCVEINNWPIDFSEITFIKTQEHYPKFILKTMAKAQDKPMKLPKVPKTLAVVLSLISLLLFIQLRALPSYYQFSWLSASDAPANQTLIAMLRNSVTFLPLKDLRYADNPLDKTWFMTSVNDTFDPNDSEYLYFPSNSSSGRLLCFLPHDRHDGAANSYGFAWPEALPHGATLLPGLTYVSDTYYDYTNLWHGIGALVPFIGWHMRRGCAVSPARWVLFHWGELRTEMATWLKSIAEAAIGKVNIETFESIHGPACFEEAVVFRHNQGAMTIARHREVFGRIRCLAREFCNVDMERIKAKDEVQMTLLLRTGARSFKNETEVVKIFEEVCAKMKNCRVKAAKSNNLTFCDQVRLLSETNVLVTAHGAQMTNMIFMERNSSIMEFYPFGWKERAGPGQYVYRWLANWSEMRHQGAYRDSAGPECNSTEARLTCLNSFKDGQIGHNVTHFSRWAAEVLQEVKEYKKNASVVMHGAAAQDISPCRCS